MRAPFSSWKERRESALAQYEAGRSLKEIAREMCISEGNARGLIKTARVERDREAYYALVESVADFRKWLNRLETTGNSEGFFDVFDQINIMYERIVMNPNGIFLTPRGRNAEGHF